MTNAELIEKLKKLPQDAQMYFASTDGRVHQVFTAYADKEDNTIVIE